MAERGRGGGEGGGGGEGSRVWLDRLIHWADERWLWSQCVARGVYQAVTSLQMTSLYEHQLMI